MSLISGHTQTGLTTVTDPTTFHDLITASLDGGMKVLEIWDSTYALLGFSVHVRQRAALDRTFRPTPEDRSHLQEVAEILADENVSLAQIIDELENIRRINLSLIKRWNLRIWKDTKDTVSKPNMTGGETGWK